MNTIARPSRAPLRGHLSGDAFFGKRTVLATAVLASIQASSPVPCRQGNRGTVRFPHDFATSGETSYSGTPMKELWAWRNARRNSALPNVAQKISRHLTTNRITGCSKTQYV